ncbi:MAG: protein arginine kinase [Planctomycetes bacterium]|nr:protein arginine kinase [Planctomycetota bacterium]
MAIGRFAGTAGEWLRGAGPEADIVISTRIRLARNVDGFPFQTRANPEQRRELADLLQGALKEVLTKERPLYVDVEKALDLDRQFLVERHLISRDLAGGEGPRGVVVTPPEDVSVMINEEDHVRLQVLHTGYQVRDTWKRADALDDALQERLPPAFSSRLGYLTACPTNVGTGLRVSVMVHLPALVITKHIEKVFYAMSKINLAVRGLYGEGTQAASDFFQISNQVTLGKTEEEILKTLESVLPEVVRYEREARQSLQRDNPSRLEDRVWRAYGVLAHARTITSEEALEKLSALRLGVNLGLVGGVDIQAVNELFILTQPAHLQKLRKDELEPAARDVARAEYLRERLKGKTK